MKELKTSQNLLNNLLANHMVLFVQTLNYHWNLTGPQFHDYHKLFDGQYKDLLEIVDEIAERVRALQGVAHGSMEQMITASSIKEDTTVPKPTVMTKKLLTQYESIIKDIKKIITTLESKTDDFGSINFLEDLLMKHEKTAWILRSLQ